MAAFKHGTAKADTQVDNAFPFPFVEPVGCQPDRHGKPDIGTEIRAGN
jgi:hypothetical protein